MALLTFYLLCLEFFLLVFLVKFSPTQGTKVNEQAHSWGSSKNWGQKDVNQVKKLMSTQNLRMQHCLDTVFADVSSEDEVILI